MRTCSRACKMYQIIDEQGNVRICSWSHNNLIGSVLEKDLNSLINSEKAVLFREKISRGDFSDCPKDNCPYLANDRMEEIMIDLEENEIYPEELYLGYEGVCNYHCTCCTSHLNMVRKPGVDYQEQYRKIEESIRDILPHVKKISANGRGELFVSKNILNILSNWKPIAPKEDIKVALETNGSLFDEEHWKKIENLGQYHLRVAITVMSFNEDIYQFLSGCKYPISQIINNLKFVKSLREKGIINELELATVIQEQNFREMPEFTRRCIEEFGVDSVRLRPIMPGGIYDESIQWFMDVRNPYHPYYEEFRKVMSNEIFKHPKVLLWSNQEDSSRGENPYWKGKAQLEKRLDEEVRVTRLLNKIVSVEGLSCKIDNLMKEEKACSLGIYGIGVIGKVFLKMLSKENLNYDIHLYDKNEHGNTCGGYEILQPAESNLKLSDVIIISPVKQAREIKDTISNFNGKLIILEDWMCQKTE